jgi:hypothetical protein
LYTDLVRERPSAGANITAGAITAGATGEVVVMGDVRLLGSIPFNYRETLHPDLFERMQQTETSDSPGLQDDLIVPKCGGGSGRRRPSSLSPKCYEYGDGDELITPVYIGPKDAGGGTSTATPPATQWSVPCGDDEDCPYWEGVEGSGRRNDKEDVSGRRKRKSFFSESLLFIFLLCTFTKCSDLLIYFGYNPVLYCVYI